MKIYKLIIKSQIKMKYFMTIWIQMIHNRLVLIEEFQQMKIL